MHEKHIELYTGLSGPDVAYVWEALFQRKKIRDRPPLDIPPVPKVTKMLLARLQLLSHAEVVLSLATDPSERAINIIETLIQKPIYVCARGETNEPLTDVRGNPLRLPIGHRRGERPNLEGNTPVRSRMSSNAEKVDNRIIVNIKPNPKIPNTAVHARYEEYQEGKSVAFHLRHTNLTRPDIRWDARKNFIQLISPKEH